MKLVLILFVFATSIAISAYAAQTVTDRLEIDNDDIPAAVDFNNLLGYQIEAIGDLDNDGVVDLAAIKFGYDGFAGDTVGDTGADPNDEDGEWFMIAPFFRTLIGQWIGIGPFFDIISPTETTIVHIPILWGDVHYWPPGEEIHEEFIIDGWSPFISWEY